MLPPSLPAMTVTVAVLPAVLTLPPPPLGPSGRMALFGISIWICV